jgi:hypothetical protein
MDNGILLKAFPSLLKRGWLLPGIVGFVSFAASFSALIVFATGWVATFVSAASETVLTAVLAAIIAQFAMSLTRAVLTRY